MDILRAKYGPSQCFRCQGFFIPADTVHALLDASSVQVNTFQRTVESPSIKNENAAFAKESTPQISWVVLKPPKNRVEKTKNTPITELSSLPRSLTTALHQQKSISGSSVSRMLHNASRLTPTPPKSPPKPHL
ncbi:hypothetical protein TNCV_3337521 [Trichonephila clavipes]|nr:hypothetical protein TNCV_3337521 [Trichonephila clavipes]